MAVALVFLAYAVLLAIPIALGMAARRGDNMLARSVDRALGGRPSRRRQVVRDFPDRRLAAMREDHYTDMDAMARARARGDSNVVELRPRPASARGGWAA